MVTQGTNDGSSGMNKGRNTSGPKNAGHQVKSSQKEAKTDDRRGPKAQKGEFGNGAGKAERNDGKGKFQRGEYKTRQAGNGNHQVKPERYDRSRNYNTTPKFSGKDDDDEDSARRSRQSRPKENKQGVSIPDKNKVQIRLEKEQKSMKKKQQSKKRESQRPQPRIKRSNNINYTKNYANGDYDDYEI